MNAEIDTQDFSLSSGQTTEEILLNITTIPDAIGLSQGNVTLDLSGSFNYFDAETLTGATTVTFGTPSSPHKRFTYTFIPSYDTSASSVDDTDTWVIDGTNYQNC